MPIYNYKATDATGAESVGAVEAANEDVASELLRERSLLVTSLEEFHQDALGFKFTFFQRVKAKDLVIFTRQISVMISASVSLTKSLRTVIRQTGSPKLRTILGDVSNEVEGGVRLSDALAKYPKVFNSFFVNMIRSGETTGKLDQVLLYLADQMERDYDLQSRVKGAMIYPIFVFGLLIVIGTIMMIFVIPKLTAVLKESGVQLPITTRMLILTSDFFVGYWWLIFGAIFGLTFVARWFYGTGPGRYAIDRMVLSLPVFGKLIRLMIMTRMMQGMSTLIEGGVDIVSTLKLVSNLTGNEVYRQAVVATVQEVAAGNTIANVWRTRKEFPQMVTQMVSVGEDTGRLQQVLQRLTEFYVREINGSVENLSKAIEPLIVVIMGGAVGVMVSAILLPMYSLAQQM